MKIPVTNTTAMPIYVGATMIPPGEIRHFDESDVPHHLRPAPVAPQAPEPAPDPLQVLVNEKTADEAIAALPGLSIEDLERLGELEQARVLKDKPAPRKSVLSAISDTLLERAAAEDGNG